MLKALSIGVLCVGLGVLCHVAEHAGGQAYCADWHAGAAVG